MCEEKRRTPPRDALTSAEYYISYYLGLHIENYIEFEQISRRRHRLALFALMRSLEGTALTPPLVGLLALPLGKDKGRSSWKPMKPGTSVIFEELAEKRRSSSSPAPSGTVIALIFTMLMALTLATQLSTIYSSTVTKLKKYD